MTEVPISSKYYGDAGIWRLKMKLLFENSRYTLEGVLSDWTAYVFVNGSKETPSEITEVGENRYRLAYKDINWYWNVEYRGSDRILIHSELENITDQDVQLGKAYILSSDGGVLNHCNEVRALGLPDRGQNPRFVLDITDPESLPETQLKYQFFSLDQKLALQIGFVSFRRLMTRIGKEVKNGHLQGLTASGDYNGWILKAGQKTEFEVFTIAFGKDPFRQLEDWASIAAEIIKPEFITEPAIGTCFGGWTYQSETRTCSERLYDNLDAVNERLAGYGVKYCWVSQTNIPGGNLGDWFGWNEDNLPGGPEKYVQEVKKRGFVPGLWNGPFQVSSALTDFVKEYWDALYKEPDGSPTVIIKGWRHGDAGNLSPDARPDVYALDASHPKARKFISDVFAYWRKIGIRYYMIDFIRAGAGDLDGSPTWSHADKTQVKGAESFCGFMEAIRKAAGPETYLLTSSGPTFQCSGYVDAVRAGCDLGETRAVKPDTFFYPASYVIKTPEMWVCAGRALYNQSSYYTHRKLYLNDTGNCLLVGKPIPLEEARINATVHAMSGCATMLSDDIREISEDRLSLIKKTFPRHTEQAKPIDLFTHKKGNPPRIYRYDFEKSAVLAVYNFSESVEEHDLKFDGPFCAWEFWTEDFCGCGKDSLHVEVPAHTVRVYRFVSKQNHPFLLGTDSSILMGELDVETRWQQGGLQLKIHRPGKNEEGCMFLYVSKGLCIDNNETACIANCGRTNDIIAALPYRTDKNGDFEETIRFSRYAEDEDALVEQDEDKFNL